MSFRFQFRRGTTAERNAANPILAAGEPAVVLDSGQPAELVLGDGVTAMADLRAAVWDDDARLALADTATQPGDLGTAAVADATDFRTAFRIEKYGTVDTTGATDSGAAVRAAIAAAYAAGGGTIEFPVGVIRIDSLPMLPNDGGVSRPVQPPLAFVGQGSHRDGTLSGSLASMPGGTVLDIRDSSGVAKIETRGRGVLTIRDLTLTNLGTADTVPFIKTTLTTLHIENIAIWGHTTKTGTGCDQDGIQCGTAEVAYAVNGSATSAYAAYGSTIDKVFFSRIRRGVYCLAGCNGLFASRLTFGDHCGATAAAGAIHIDGTGDQAGANQFSDIILESMNYEHPIHLKNASSNTFRGLQIWDSTATLITAILHEPTCNGNFYQGYITAPPKRITGSGASFQTDGFLDIVLGSRGTVIRSQEPLQSDAHVALSVNRSLSDPVNPGAQILNLLQSGNLGVIGSSPQVSAYNPTTNKRFTFTASGNLGVDSGHLMVYPGTTATDKVVIGRGLLEVTYGTTAQRPNPNGAPGCVFFDLTLNKPIFSNASGAWVDATGTAV